MNKSKNISQDILQNLIRVWVLLDLLGLPRDPLTPIDPQFTLFPDGIRMKARRSAFALCEGKYGVIGNRSSKTYRLEVSVIV